MVKLYKFDNESKSWKLVDYGLKHLADKYTKQGYVVVFV